MNLKLPKTALYFLGAIFILNLLQSYFTELIFDEAYYWYYAQNMAWGYFDHPPMVALLIKISSFVFKGELGVRFMSCILSVGTLIILWLLIDNKKKKDYVAHFFVLTFSMTLLNAYGFLTLPDTPLLFFTATFLLVYKNFIKSPTLLLSIIMGIIMAALMYSKYHAVIIILFVLLSNLKLVFNKYAWVSIVVALLCYTPHFIWLLNNNFVSIKYHLFERPNQAYEFIDFTLGFFINLVALFGFTFPWVYYALFKTKMSDKFTKALVYLTYGILLFFFISSFDRRVQTQWIIIISIPLVVIVFNYILANEKFKKGIYRVAMINIAILLFARIGLIYAPILPIVYESHGNKVWVQEIQSQAGSIPVVFDNSYGKSSMYAFYSRNDTYSLNNIRYRQNQYSIDSSEYRVQHKKVLYVSGYLTKGDITYTTAKGKIYYGNYIKNFESFRKLRCFIEEKHISPNSDQELTLKVYNPYKVAIKLEKLKFGLAYLNDHKQVEETKFIRPTPLNNKELLTLASLDTTYFKFKLPKPTIEDLGYFRMGISENGLHLGLNGENIKLE